MDSYIKSPFLLLPPSHYLLFFFFSDSLPLHFFFFFLFFSKFETLFPLFLFVVLIMATAVWWSRVHLFGYKRIFYCFFVYKHIILLNEDGVSRRQLWNGQEDNEKEAFPPPHTSPDPTPWIVFSLSLLNCFLQLFLSVLLWFLFAELSTSVNIQMRNRGCNLAENWVWLQDRSSFGFRTEELKRRFSTFYFLSYSLCLSSSSFLVAGTTRESW